MSKGVVQIYYGEGRGKSNAAIGSAIGAACEGREAIVIEFLKGKNEQNMEFLNRLEPEVKFFNFSRAGIFFDELDEENKQEEIMNIKNGFNYAKKVVSTSADALIVLDELLGLLDLHLVELSEVKELLESRGEDVTVVCTGRVLDEGIKALADEIYNIESHK